MAEGHGGVAVARALKALDVDHLFTLTGGHIFPIFDGAKNEGIKVVDFRHEQSATFAAEAWSRLTRRLGVVALTAGPGVTNALSALAQARFNSASVLALGGRAPMFRWGQGSLQEIDHVPFVDPIATASTVGATDELFAQVYAAGTEATLPPRGPRFLDMPLDVLFNQTDVDGEPPAWTDWIGGSIDQLDAAAALLQDAERPMIVAGSNVWLDGAADALRELAEKHHVPVYMNGQGRGCLPADHDLAFSRSRSAAMKQADVVIVAGTPLDFRLGFGQNFATGTKIVHIDAAGVARHVPLGAGIENDTRTAFEAMLDAAAGGPDRSGWVTSLREVEAQKAAQAQDELTSDALPIHPMRIYGELKQVLDRDAVVICDGGDFASYAGREIASYEPGCWLDPGPYGCLGVGPGYAAAARLAHADRQVVVLYGDGAFGFSCGDLETLTRLNLPCVMVVGNNGIWGLEKHPMRALFGYDLAADLQPGLELHKVMEAFGGAGETVAEPGEIRPALDRAFSSGVPYLVNVLTDPEIAYPRSANLA